VFCVFFLVVVNLVVESMPLDSDAEQGMGRWVMGQMGHENEMGHMGHGSLGDDP